MGTVMVLAGRVKARARRAGGCEEGVGKAPTLHTISHTPHTSPHLFAHPEVLSFLVNLALCQQ
jgi:hypothetical protein